MLDKITLKFTAPSEEVTVPAQGVTIFVGPNNSGKSLVLVELEASISTQHVQTKLVKDFEIIWPEQAQLEADIANLTRKAPPSVSADHVYVGRFTPDGNLEANTLTRAKLTERIRRTYSVSTHQR